MVLTRYQTLLSGRLRFVNIMVKTFAIYGNIKQNSKVIKKNVDRQISYIIKL